MKAIYDNKPLIIEAVGNGSYLYRWNITSQEISMDNISKEQWSCDEVIVWKNDVQSIKQAAINEVWGHDVENKYINDFNAANSGILDSSYIDAYKQFLSDRKALKDQIGEDCKQLGII